MKILYVTLNVLGDAGANAAELFPRYCVGSPDTKDVIVADYSRNRHIIRERQYAQFLRMRRGRKTIFNAVRIARKSKQENIDIIHVFYRQNNALLVIYLRLFLIFFRAKAKIVMDHRSVNLARGMTGFRKKTLNQTMQFFTHYLAGNPWAPETNHFFLFRKPEIIDLGYDQLPDAVPKSTEHVGAVNVWFIGSLKPRNRKSDFLLDMFDHINADPNSLGKIEINVAGPTNKRQRQRLNANPCVNYHGKLPRLKLYELLQNKAGIGIAYMNQEFHAYAPSLKFCEYAIMRYQIIASDTLGLRTQAERMNLDGVTFVRENAKDWATETMKLAESYVGLQPVWEEADKWSYRDIFDRQVIGLYKKITTQEQ